MRPFASLAALLVLFGCAHGRGAPDPRSRAGEHVYEQPISAVWPAVRDHFQKEGYRVREDGESFSLVTEWRERFANSAVAGTFTRYIVLGDPLGPTRCKIRVFVVQRTNDRTLDKPGANIGWGPRDDIGAQGGGGIAADEESDAANAPTLQQWSEAVDAADGTLRAEALGASAQRDLDMEWALLQRIEPQIAAQYEAGKTVIARPPLQSQPVEVAAADSGEAPIDCGDPVPGLAALAQPGRVLLLGEIPGTREVPRFVGNVACQAALSMAPVTVGLELPISEEDRVFRYLSSKGTAEDRAALLDGPFWGRPYQDGRSSEGMVELLERLRQMRARGLDVLVFSFETLGLQFDAHEQALTQAVLREVQNHPGRFFTVLTGESHARLVQGNSFDARLRPMGLRLSEALPDRVTSLDMAFGDGTAWICAMERKLDCGVRPAKGVDNGRRAFIHLWTAGQKNGYDGIFYVGGVNASLPARGVADAR